VSIYHKLRVQTSIALIRLMILLYSYSPQLPREQWPSELEDNDDVHRKRGKIWFAQLARCWRQLLLAGRHKGRCRGSYSMLITF